MYGWSQPLKVNVSKVDCVEPTYPCLIDRVHIKNSN